MEWLTGLFNAIFRTFSMPEEWRWSTMIPFYEKKGDINNCSNYRDIKLLSHTKKVWERVVEIRVRRGEYITENQYGLIEPQKSHNEIGGAVYREKKCDFPRGILRRC